MISRCYYINDSKFTYTDDYVIRLPKIKSKNFIVIYHNVPEMTGLDFYNQLIDNLYSYKTVYTSEPNTVYYTPLDSSKPCDSKFDIGQLDSIIKIACVRLDTLYVVFVITPNPVILSKNLISPIQCINFSQFDRKLPDNLLKYQIKIKDTNIHKDLIGTTWEFENSELVIFICSSNLSNFSCWIKYTVDGFDRDEKFQDLLFVSNPDIEAQILGLKNLIMSVTKENFYSVKTKFLHTARYYNSLSQDQKFKLSELMGSANIVFSMTQNSIMCENLSETNVADSLFSKSFKTTPPFITWKQSKTLAANKNKASTQSIDMTQPIDLTQLIKSDPLFIKSMDQYVSSISLSNWYEEYENRSCLGLLVNIQATYSDKMGWTTDTINIKITNTLIARDQIYDGHEYFWNQNNRLDNGKMEINLISGSGIGSGNSMLPLYINKFHWSVAKNYLEEQISIGITQNPYLFKPIMLGLYSHILIKIISQIITSGCSTPLIKTLIWVALTMKKLDSNKTQNRDIIVYLSEYFFKWIEHSNTSQDLNKMSESEIFKIYEDLIRYNMKIDFKTKKEIQFLTHTDILNISSNNVTDFENFVVFTGLPINTYINNLIKQADESYGYIDELGPDFIELKNTIKSNEKFFKTNDMFAKFDYAQAIQTFTYQCFLSRTPKLKSRLESTIGLIDFTSENLNNQMILDQLVKLNRIIS